jgi:hypothetical protein
VFGRNLGADMLIDLGAEAPTTNLRDLGADVFGRKYKPMCLPFSKPIQTNAFAFWQTNTNQCLPFGKPMCLPFGKEGA